MVVSAANEIQIAQSRWMRRALVEAHRGQGFVEPNPMVGAVIVNQGVAVGIGHHAFFGGPHAEIEAIAQAGDQTVGATLYVTLEPCCHHGKTPPCVEAVKRAGISRVVMAQTDPFPQVAGGGLAALRSAGIVVEVGVEAAAAERLNAPYLKRHRVGRPYVIGKWAMTLDGRIATSTGQSQWISNERSRGLVHELRGRMDAIAVGIGTALADSPRLTARPSGPRVPARIILDPAAQLPLDSVLVQTARKVPVWVAVSQRAPSNRVSDLKAAGCEILAFESEGRIPLDSLLDCLGQRGVTNLLLEGGPRVAGAFLDAGEIDEVWAFIAPLIEGGSHSGSPILGRGVDHIQARQLQDIDIVVLDSDILMRGTLSQAWRYNIELGVHHA